MLMLRFLGGCLIKILKIKFDQDLCKKLTKKKLVTLVSRTQPLGSVVPLAILSYVKGLKNTFFMPFS